MTSCLLLRTPTPTYVWVDTFDIYRYMPSCLLLRTPTPTYIYIQIGHLAIIGDSHQRHLTQALLTVLLGDYAHGTSLRVRHGEPGFRRCDCDAVCDDGHAAYFRVSM